MVVTNKKATSILLGFIVLIGQMQNAFAEMMQKGRTKLKVLANLYHQNSNDGAQVVDNFDLRSPFDKSIDKVRTNKRSAASNEYPLVIPIHRSS